MGTNWRIDLKKIVVQEQFLERLTPRLEWILKGSVHYYIAVI